MYPHIEKAVASFAEKHTEATVFCTPIDFNMAELGVVLHGHPTAESNEHAAEELSAYLWKNLPDRFDAKQAVISIIRELVSKKNG